MIPFKGNFRIQPIQTSVPIFLQLLKIPENERCSSVVGDVRCSSVFRSVKWKHWLEMGKCSLQKGKHSGMFHCTCCNAIHIGVVFALVCFHCFLEHNFARFIFIFEFSLFYVEKLQEFVKPLVCFLCFP